MPPTPTANISSKYSPSPSRLPEHDAPSPPPPLPAPSPPPQRTSTSRKRRRPANMVAEHASSSSDSSSQSGIADNETEAEPTHPSERPVPQLVPPKKKRTRTLTTPHQSAVLHALLAKSRFPTTAMREEVGRQIGLSARKVQIWFQNQRQKARRPQTDSAPLSRPPQFGPFPIMTPASYPSPSTIGPASQGSSSAPDSAQSPLDSAASLDSKSALSASGQPSWSPSSYQRGPRSAEERDPPLRPLTSSGTPLGNAQLPRLSLGISTPDNARGPAPRPTLSTHVETSPHFSGALPPITLEPRSSTESYVSTTPSFPPQPPSRTFVNAAQSHDPPARTAIEKGSPARPPPLVLQPQPQWDPQTFVPYTRPEFGSWLQSSARTSVSSVGTHDRAMHPLSPSVSRRRLLYPSAGEPSPVTRQMVAPRRRHAPSRGSGHARSDDEAGEG